MTRKEKVSVVTPVYNEKENIKKTINSIEKQSYKKTEYIVVDGGSTDGTANILKENRKVVDMLISEEDDGIYDAMNKGIRKCNGSIIGILNAGDWYEKNTIKKVAHVAKMNPNIGLIHGDMCVWSKDGEKMSIYSGSSRLPPVYGAPFNHPTCFVRPEVYRDLGLFDLEFRTAADYDFMLRFLNSDWKSMYLDKVLTNFRQGGATSQYKVSPINQLWPILRRNEYSLRQSMQGILFRVIRDVTAQVVKGLKISWARQSLRSIAPYHKESRKN